MILLNKNLLQHTVLAKSVLKAAYRLGLNEEGLKKVLKFNDASPIVKLDPTSEFGQQGLLLIQLFQSLSSLTNGEEVAIKIFMNSKNHLTKGIPIQQIEDRVGLINVVECVESLSQQEF